MFTLLQQAYVFVCVSPYITYAWLEDLGSVVVYGLLLLSRSLFKVLIYVGPVFIVGKGNAHIWHT